MVRVHVEHEAERSLLYANTPTVCTRDRALQQRGKLLTISPFVPNIVLRRNVQYARAMSQAPISRSCHTRYSVDTAYQPPSISFIPHSSWLSGGSPQRIHMSLKFFTVGTVQNYSGSLGNDGGGNTAGETWRASELSSRHPIGGPAREFTN